MWTWTKTQQGCYLKNESEDTTYVERFDEGRVSGGWDSSVHLNTNTFYDGDATSTTVLHAAFNDNGVMVDPENENEGHTAATEEGAVDHDVDHLHRRLSAEQEMEVVNAAGSNCKLNQLGSAPCNQKGGWPGDGSHNTKLFKKVGETFMLISGPKPGNECSAPFVRGAGVSNPQTEATCKNACLADPLCTHVSYQYQGSIAILEPVVVAPVPLQGIDYPSEDYIKFSNGRPEARTPASCEEACTANEKCEYWSWSHNDPQASCYLKSNFAMADKSFSYGYPVRKVVRMLTALSAAQPPSSHHRTPITSSSSPSLTTDPRPWRRVGLHARRRRRRWLRAAAARSGDHPSQEL